VLASLSCSGKGNSGFIIFLQTFLVFQQLNHHFVTLSLGEIATHFSICFQEGKYSGESGADFVCVCVCVRASV
jgi:hypothetical protein